MSTEPRQRALFFRLILPLLLILGVVGLFWGIGVYQRGKSTELKKGWIEKFAQLEEQVDSEDLGNLDKLRRLPIVYRDRVQPLDSVARRELRKFSGSRTLYDADPVAMFLSMAFDDLEEFWKDVPLFSVSYGTNRGIVGIDSIEKLASYEDVRRNEKLERHVNEVREEYKDKGAQMPLPDQELVRMYFSHSRELDLKMEHLLKIVPPTEGQRVADGEDARDWHFPSLADMEGHDPAKAAVVDKAWTDLGDAWRARDATAIGDAADRLIAGTEDLDPASMPESKQVENELSMNVVNPFNLSMWLYLSASLFALFSFAFGSKALRIVAILLGVIGMALSIYGFYMRLTLGFGVAITNLYESMVAVSFTTMLICLSIDAIRGGAFGTIVGGVGSFVVLALLDRYSAKFDDAIGGTIAVLANNIWVHIHVPVIMAAYAAFFIAFLLSFIALPWAFRDRKASNPELGQVLKTAEISIHLGTLLAFVGIVLGGVWAADSWGRFWGWDPKETWAAILFVYYVIIIHLRWAPYPNPARSERLSDGAHVGIFLLTGGLFFPIFWRLFYAKRTKRKTTMSPFWFALMAFFGGNVLLWTYYGTNELLSGLHSYANSAGGATFWDNFIHDRNRWFVWTTVTMTVVTALAAIAYLLRDENEEATVSAEPATK